MVALVGDGGLMLGIGEIATMVQENLNMILLVMNDKGYGVMRGIQDNYFGGRQYYNELHTPSYKKHWASRWAVIVIWLHRWLSPKKSLPKQSARKAPVLLK